MLTYAVKIRQGTSIKLSVLIWFKKVLLSNVAASTLEKRILGVRSLAEV